MPVEFLLKSGDGVLETGLPPPPYLIQFSVAPNHVLHLRDKARAILDNTTPRSSSTGSVDDSERAEGFLSEAVTADALLDAGQRTRMACVLLFRCTDTPERLSAVIEGRVARAGLIMTTRIDRSRQIAAAVQSLSPPLGGGFASAMVDAGQGHCFRYVVQTSDSALKAR